jgi:hypothetical protein
MDDWYPIQAKQQDKVGRPAVDEFETGMNRAGRKKGYCSPVTRGQTYPLGLPESRPSRSPSFLHGMQAYNLYVARSVCFAPVSPSRFGGVCRMGVEMTRYSQARNGHA